MKKTQEVRIIARYQVKATEQVFYKVRSSDGSTTYCVTMLQAHAAMCDCPARKPCKHMKACTAYEAKRNAPQQQPQQQESLAEALYPTKVQGQREIVQDLVTLTQQLAAMLAENDADDMWQDESSTTQQEVQTEATESVEKAPVSYGWDIDHRHWEMRLWWLRLRKKSNPGWRGLMLKVPLQGCLCFVGRLKNVVVGCHR